MDRSFSGFYSTAKTKHNIPLTILRLTRNSVLSYSLFSCSIKNHTFIFFYSVNFSDLDTFLFLLSAMWWCSFCVIINNIILCPICPKIAGYLKERGCGCCLYYPFHISNSCNSQQTKNNVSWDRKHITQCF